MSRSVRASVGTGVGGGEKSSTVFRMAGWRGVAVDREGGSKLGVRQQPFAALTVDGVVVLCGRRRWHNAPLPGNMALPVLARGETPSVSWIDVSR
jgi:hypothetical protein